MSEFEDFVPQVDDLLPLLASFDLERPSREERVIALLVVGKGVARKSWVDDVEVSERLFRRLMKNQMPDGDLAATETKTFALLHESSRSASVGRCSECWYDRGRVLCPVCGGSGLIPVGDGTISCNCDRGKLTCGHCDGTGKALKVKVVYYEDAVQTFGHVFAPELEAQFRERVQKFLRSRAFLPEVLQFSLDEELDPGDAYRGRVTAGYHRGHRVGRGVELAKQYLGRLERLPSVAAISHRAWTWPMLSMRWTSGYVAVAVCDEDGKPQLL